jgi:hypothetical protein
MLGLYVVMQSMTQHPFSRFVMIVAMLMSILMKTLIAVLQKFPKRVALLRIGQ